MSMVCSKIALRLCAAGLLLFAGVAAQGQGRAIVPTNASANRFYSPGVEAGGYVYISGQGPRRPDGSLPVSFSEQVKQTLDNVQAVVKSGGLTMENVVYVQIYLQDMNRYDELKKAFATYFGKSQPAEAVLGVARIPESSIQVNAVAVRNL